MADMAHLVTTPPAMIDATVATVAIEETDGDPGRPGVRIVKAAKAT